MPPYRLRSGLLYFLCITGSAATRLRPFATIIPPSGLKIPRAFSPINDFGVSAEQHPLIAGANKYESGQGYEAGGQRFLMEKMRKRDIYLIKGRGGDVYTEKADGMG